MDEHGETILGAERIETMGCGHEQDIHEQDRHESDKHDLNAPISYPAGIKWTRQRRDVYHVLVQASEPLSAVQIYKQIAKSGEDDYAVSTIYRILAAFEEKGLVSKSTFMGDGTVVYEWNRGEHTHYAVCLACHKRVPLPSCPFAHVHLDPDTGDFTVTGHKLELYGYCKDCQTQKNTEL